MGTANVNIKIIGSYNGRAVERAMAGLEKLNAQAALVGSGAAAAFTKSGTALLQQGAVLENVGYKAEAFGQKWLGVSVGIAAVAYATGKAAVDIDTSLTNVKKTVDGTTEQYEELKQKAIEFSKTNAVSASQILDIQSIGAQLGFAIDELDEMSRVTAGLDIATNMDAETAASEMARFANITKMAHSEISNYGSSIVGLGNNFATTEAEISAMAMRLAASGTQVGMSQADILGLATALSSLGVEAEAGGTAVSTIMASIDKSVAKAADYAKLSNAEFKRMTKEQRKEVLETNAALATYAETAGMSAEDFMQAWKTKPVEALGALLSNMEKVTAEGGNMSVMLEELGIDGIRQTDVMKRMAGNSELVAKAVGKANEEWTSNTALQNEVDNRNASLAARIEILKNKVTAYAEEVGTPLVNSLLAAADASEPFLQFIGQAADAFAAADESTQQQILGIVALAGVFPLLSMAGGKYLQVVGGTVKAIGAKQRAIGSLINLTRTNEVELLKRTAAEGTFAQKLAISCNSFAKKTSAVAADTQAQKISTTALKANTAQIKTSEAAVVGFGMKTKTATAAVGANTIALKAGSAAAKSFGLALKAAAPIAIISGVIMLADKIGEAVEKQQKYEKATEGLSKATGALPAAFEKARGSVEGLGKNSETTKTKIYDLNGAIDKSIERNAELAEKITGIYETAGNSLGELETYRSTIENLGDAGEMSQSSAARLKLALEGVNEKCGTSYELTGNTADGYKIMADGAEVAKDQILKLVDAQKIQIQLDASKEAYKEAYKGLADSAQAATKATQNYNSILGQYEYWAEEAQKGTLGAAEAMNGMAWQVVDAESKMNTANATYKTQKGVVDELYRSQTLYQMALDAGGDSIAAAVAQNDLLTAAFQNQQKDSAALVGALETLGVSTSTLASLTVDETNTMATAFDGTAASVSQALFSMATNASSQGSNAGKWLSDNFSAEAQGIINAATDTAGLTTAQFKLIADEAGVSGEDAVKALANAIINNSSTAEGGARIVKQALILEFTDGDVEAAAKILGEDIDEGLAAGITGSSEMPAAAIGVMSQETIDKAKTAFESHSPSQVMHRLGGDIDTGLAQGITGSQDQPITSLASVAQSALNAILGAPSSAWQTGSNTAGGFASGIGSGSAYSEGAALAGTGQSGLESVSANGAGVDFVSGFGLGMGNVDIWKVAWDVGNTALNAIKSALGIASPSKEAAIVGAFFDQGLIAGMRKEEAAVAKQAASLETAMQINPQLPQWEQAATIPIYEQPAAYRRSGGVYGENGKITNNYYTFGNITLNAADAAGAQGIDDIFAIFTRAARMNPERMRG